MAPGAGGEKKGPPPVVKKVLGLFGAQREEDRLAGYLSFLKVGGLGRVVHQGEGQRRAGGGSHMWLRSERRIGWLATCPSGERIWRWSCLCSQSLPLRPFPHPCRWAPSFSSLCRARRRPTCAHGSPSTATGTRWVCAHAVCAVCSHSALAAKGWALLQGK